MRIYRSTGTNYIKSERYEVVYKPNYLRNIDRSMELSKARKCGIAVISGAIGLGLFISELNRIRGLPFEVMNCGYIALFAITFLLIFFWIWSTGKELNLLFKWLDPERYEPPSGIRETLIILSIAVLLVVLLFTSRNPLLYSSIFSIYALVNFFGKRLQQIELDNVLTKSRDRARKDLSDNNLLDKAKLYIKVIENLECYFVKRPHNLRLILIFISSLAGLGLSVYWTVTQSSVFGIGAYIVLFMTITVGELTIWRWRSIRDRQLRPIIAELYELIRNNSE